MTAQQFAIILGLVESGGNPNSPLGDSGLAFGRYQIHPAWLYDHILLPGVDESWDSWTTRMVVAFFNLRSSYLPPVEIAMWFHLGHRTQASEDDWDTAYAKRFSDFSAKVLK